MTDAKPAAKPRSRASKKSAAPVAEIAAEPTKPDESVEAIETVEAVEAAAVRKPERVPPVLLSPASVMHSAQPTQRMLPGTDLFDYFASNTGRLIFKWMHYFDIYEKHFAAFRNRDIKFLEIGVFHGGSLQMWKNYFGPRAQIIGVDINPKCKEFEEDNIHIEIGSQEDRGFLRELAAKHGPFDIVLDDGGHSMGQQIVSFQELYNHVRRDGLYLCEDLHTSYWKEWGGGYRHQNTFIEFAKGLIDELHAWHSKDPESFQVSTFTQSAFGLHFYDSMLVIEKRLVTPPLSRATGTPSF